MDECDIINIPLHHQLDVVYDVFSETDLRKKRTRYGIKYYLKKLGLRKVLCLLTDYPGLIIGFFAYMWDNHKCSRTFSFNFKDDELAVIADFLVTHPQYMPRISRYAHLCQPPDLLKIIDMMKMPPPCLEWIHKTYYKTGKDWGRYAKLLDVCIAEGLNVEPRNEGLHIDYGKCVWVSVYIVTNGFLITRENAFISFIPICDDVKGGYDMLVNELKRMSKIEICGWCYAEYCRERCSFRACAFEIMHGFPGDESFLSLLSLDVLYYLLEFC